jgi:hypothetical protein
MMGEGRDSIYTRMVCPTAMVFTHCRDRILYSQMEYASSKGCSVGAQTILGLSFDMTEMLRSTHHE